MKKLINLSGLQLVVLLLVTSCTDTHTLNWGGVKDYSLNDLKSKDIKTILGEEGFEGRELRRTARKDIRTLLCWAAEKGATPIVMKLLAESVNNRNIDDMIDNDKNPAMMLAAKAGHVEIVELLLNKGADPDQSNGEGEKAIYWAAKEGHDEIVELLIDKGAQIDGTDNHGNTALMMAALFGKTKVVELLLEEGASLHQKNYNGYDACSWAIIGGRINMVKLLGSQGAQMGGNDNFMLAAEKGSVEIMKLLLQEGDIDINKSNKEGYTPLLMAAKKGRAEAVKFLLQDKRVDPNVTVNNSTTTQTALMLAAEHGHLEAVKVLITDTRIDAGQETRYGETALDYAVSNNHTAVIEFLSQQGGNIDPIALSVAVSKGAIGTIKAALANENIEDYAVSSLFEAAIRNVKPEIIKLLLATNHVNPNIADKVLGTPLAFAASEGKFAIVDLLLQDERVDPNIQYGTFQETALVRAAGRGKTEMVARLLQDRRVDPNIKCGSSQETALMQAAEHGHAEAVKLLLEDERTNLSLKCKQKQTALKKASRQGHKEIVVLIKQAKKNRGKKKKGNKS